MRNPGKQSFGKLLITGIVFMILGFCGIGYIPGKSMTVTLIFAIISVIGMIILMIRAYLSRQYFERASEYKDKVYRHHDYRSQKAA